MGEFHSIKRIGILGGSFDPPHRGHFLCARAVAEKLQLDCVLVIPANIQPHKLEGSVASAELRLKMTRAACRKDPLFRVSDIEIVRGGVSYTIDTLRAISAQFPAKNNQLFLLLGADAVADLQRWREPEEILRLATIVMMERGDTSLDKLPVNWLERIVHAKTPNIEISSTEVRKRIAANTPIKWHVPQSVEKIIKQYSLYS